MNKQQKDTFRMVTGSLNFDGFFINTVAKKGLVYVMAQNASLKLTPEVIANHLGGIPRASVEISVCPDDRVMQIKILS